jgi:CRP-like cAMP-binding protein
MQLDRPVRQALQAVIQPKKYNKGDYLLRAGEVCRYSYFIEKGLARKFYLKDGVEITTDFSFPDDILVSFRSYTLQQPGREYIQVLADSTVQQTDYLAFQRLKWTHKKLLEIDLLLTEYYAMWLEERLYNLQFHTAAERYGQLLDTQPHLVQQVPLSYIASYLGITLETLSRIRAKK